MAAVCAGPRRHVLDLPLPASDALRLRRDLPIRRAAALDARARRAAAGVRARSRFSQGARGVAPDRRDDARRAGGGAVAHRRHDGAAREHRRRLSPAAEQLLDRPGPGGRAGREPGVPRGAGAAERLAGAGAHPGRGREPRPRSCHELRGVPRARVDRLEPPHDGSLLRRHGDGFLSREGEVPAARRDAAAEMGLPARPDPAADHRGRAADRAPARRGAAGIPDREPGLDSAVRRPRHVRHRDLHRHGFRSLEPRLDDRDLRSRSRTSFSSR